MSDIDDAIARLEHHIGADTDLALSFVIGSGLSASVLPNTEQMTEMFCAALGPYATQFKLTELHGLDGGGRYRAAAEALERRQGPRAVSAVIRKAIQQALLKDHPMERPFSDIPNSDWNVPAAYLSLAKVLVKLPSSRRNAIFTTNFDPLLEVALERVGVPHTTLSTSRDNSPLGDIKNSLPVVHLHGYFDNASTFNATAALSASRPRLESDIAEALRKSVTVIMGYGGWDDAFSRALTSFASGSTLPSLDASIIWVTHGPTSILASQPHLSALAGTPGITEFLATDASRLLETVATSASHDGQDEVPVPGWIRIIARRSGSKALQTEALEEGREVSFETAIAAPQLSNGDRVEVRFRAALADSSSGGVVAVGPTGEGKTIALQQTAKKLAAEGSESDLIIHRTAGAPRMTGEEVERLTSAYSRVILVVDDADLVLEELVDACAAGVRNGSVKLLMAMHRHYLSSHQTLAALHRLSLERIDFQGLSWADASSLVDFWTRISPQQQSYSVDSLYGAAGAHPGDNSLYGALLDQRFSPGLESRTVDLLERVARLRVNHVSLEVVLLAIAVGQLAWDEKGSGSGGLTIGSVAGLLGLQSDTVVRVVIEPLGREAGISRVGDRVYVRHPKIATSLLKVAGPAKRNQVLERIGEAAGKMRMLGDVYSRQDTRPLYNLGPRLSPEDAITWGKALVAATPGLLETRVSMLRALRSARRWAVASRYAQGVEDRVGEFEDRARAYRGLLVEWAWVENAQGHPAKALGLALGALSDLPGYPLWSDNVGYALGAAKGASERLLRQRVAGARECLVALERLLALHEGEAGRSAAYHVSTLKRYAPNVIAESTWPIAFRDLVKELDGHRATGP